MKRKARRVEVDVDEENRKKEKIRILMRKIFGAKVSEEDLSQRREELEKQRDLYLQGVTDSLKWTSAIVVGAILWIGNIITSIPGYTRIIAIGGLVFLVMSLFLAIIAANEILDARARYWKMANQAFDHSVVFFEWKRDPSLFDEKDIYETVLNSLEELEKVKPYLEPDRFVCWVNWHRNFLLFGLILYLISEIVLSYNS